MNSVRFDDRLGNHACLVAAFREALRVALCENLLESLTLWLSSNTVSIHANAMVVAKVLSIPSCLSGVNGNLIQ